MKTFFAFLGYGFAIGFGGMLGTCVAEDLIYKYQHKKECKKKEECACKTEVVM